VTLAKYRSKSKTTRSDKPLFVISVVKLETWKINRVAAAAYQRLPLKRKRNASAAKMRRSTKTMTFVKLAV
jgi:hypothetical protein